MFENLKFETWVKDRHPNAITTKPRTLKGEYGGTMDRTWMFVEYSDVVLHYTLVDQQGYYPFIVERRPDGTAESFTLK